MTMLPLSALDLALASLGVLAVAALTWRLRLGLAGGLLLAALRTVVQLLLVGLVLRIEYELRDRKARSEVGAR